VANADNADHIGQRSHY